MKEARLDEVRLMDAQEDQRVEELDATRCCASLLVRKTPSATAARHEPATLLLLRACTDSTPQHNE
jgi:hypothetical protein